MSANELRTEAEQQGQSLGSRLTKKLSKRLSIGGSKDGAKEGAIASSSKEPTGESGIGQQVLNKDQETKDQATKGDVSGAKDIATKGENTKNSISQGDTKGAVAGIGLTGSNVNKKNAENVSTRLGGYRPSISRGPLEYNDDIKKGPITTGIQRDTGQTDYGGGGSGSGSKDGGLDTSKKELGQTPMGDSQIRQGTSQTQQRLNQTPSAPSAIGTDQSQPGLSKDQPSLSQGEKGLSPTQKGLSQSQQGMGQGLSSAGKAAGATIGGDDMMQQELRDQLAIGDDVFGSPDTSKAASKSAKKSSSKQGGKSGFGAFGGGALGNIFRRASGQGKSAKSNIGQEKPVQTTSQTSKPSKPTEKHGISRGTIAGAGAGAGAGAALGGLGTKRALDNAGMDEKSMGQIGMTNAGMANSGIASTVDKSGMGQSGMGQGGMSKNGMPATAIGAMDSNEKASKDLALHGGKVRGGNAIMSGSDSPKTTGSSGKVGAAAAAGVGGAAGTAGMAGMAGMTGARGDGLNEDLSQKGLSKDASSRGISGAASSTTTNTSGVSTRAVRGLSTSTHKVTILQDKVQAVAQKCKTQLGMLSDEISQRSPTVNTFFDAVAAERLRWMPRDGSRLDCSLRWASRLAYAVDALRESTGLFTPGADTAAQLIWGFMILLLESDMDNTDLFESVFGRYGRVAVGIYLLIQYESAYKTSTSLQPEAAAVFSDLLEMVCTTTTSCVEGFKAKESTQLIEHNVDAAFVTYAKRYSTHWNAIVESATSNLVKQSSLIYSSPELGSLRQFLGVQDRPLQFILESRMHSLAEGSFEWFNSALYDFSIGKSPVMLVTGGAGSGKSALAQWTVERLQESAEHDSWNVIPYTIREY